jgi:lipopolysaccharide transport system permease protein
VAYPLRRTLRLEPPSSWQMPSLAELWAYRELLFFFVWRDVKVRYKQTCSAPAGRSSSRSSPPSRSRCCSPLRRHGQAGAGTVALYVFVGMLPWTFFTNAVTAASNSLIGSSHLISKVYFPRIIIPVAAIAVGLVDFAVSFVVMLLMMAAYGVAPTPQMLLLPVFLAGTIVSAAAAGVLFAALIVTYRDVRYIMAFVMQLWLFGTPVLYNLEIIPQKWHTLYALNPMAGMIAGFRTSVLGGLFPERVILISSLSALVLLVGGVRYFMLVERRFADVI